MPYAVATVWLGQEFVAREVLPILALVAVGAIVGAVAIRAFRRHLVTPEDAPASAHDTTPGGTRPDHGRAASS
ncbi:MAG: hypothetical protein ACK6DK_00910 [Gemmatimonadota bacterium]